MLPKGEKVVSSDWWLDMSKEEVVIKLVVGEK